jgi:hypothetical protein
MTKTAEPTIPESDSDFAFLESIMLRQRGHRQPDTAEVVEIKLRHWAKELRQLLTKKARTSEDKKRIHAIRQNISRTNEKHPLLLKKLVKGSR